MREFNAALIQMEIRANRKILTMDNPLEREAVALVKQYGFFLPGPVKVFLNKLADSLNWQELKKVL